MFGLTTVKRLHETIDKYHEMLEYTDKKLCRVKEENKYLIDKLGSAYAKSNDLSHEVLNLKDKLAYVTPRTHAELFPAEAPMVTAEISLWDQLKVLIETYPQAGRQMNLIYNQKYYNIRIEEWADVSGPKD